MFKKINIYILVFASIPIITSVLLQFLPLANTTGYEFSFMMTIPLFIFSGWFVIRYQDYNLNRSILLFVFVVPLAISLFSNLFFTDCPISIDALFYLVLSFPSFLIGLMIGSLVKEYFGKFRIILLFITLILLLSISLFEFYFRPQIYFYNPILGYFPGTMFDENISITTELIIYRLFSLSLFLLLFFLSVGLKISRSYFSLIAVLLFLTWILFLKPLLKFSTTNDKIKSELTQELVTEHFRIFTDSSLNYDTTSLKNLHEFFYKETVSELDLKDNMVITSYLFKDSYQKKKLFGSENADVAKPWLKQIYLDQQSFTGSLKHEIVHILASAFGNAPFYVAKNINPALIEGLAMAIENNYDDLDIDYISNMAMQHGYGINISILFDGFNFFGNLSSTSYLISGSFIRYLLKVYGSEKVKLVYKTGDFEKTFNKELTELESEFIQYIDSFNYGFSKNSAQLYFGRQPLIDKTCPRMAARIEAKGWQLYDQKKYEDAIDDFEFVYNSVGSYSSLNGILLSQIQVHDYQAALDLSEEKLNSFSNTSYFYNLILRNADLAILNLDSSRALNYINMLCKYSPAVYYSNESVSRKLLLNRGVHNYKNYLLNENLEKYNILKNIAKDSIDITSVIPRLIQLKRSTEELDSDFFNFINDLNFDRSPAAVFAYYKLSEYYFSKNMLDEAIYFSNLAIEINEKKEFAPVLEEQNKLINWSIMKTHN